MPDSEEYKTMLAAAIELVLHERKANVTFLQRRLGVWVGRAMRLQEDMADRGIISPLARGQGKPEVLLTVEEYAAQQKAAAAPKKKKARRKPNMKPLRVKKRKASQ